MERGREGGGEARRERVDRGKKLRRKLSLQKKQCTRENNGPQGCSILVPGACEYVFCMTKTIPKM